MHRIKQLWRDPLTHFVLLGALLFGGYQVFAPDASGAPTSKEIRLTLDDVAQLVSVFEARWGRPPTPQELDLLVEDKVRQEILYREALAMGLDRDDEIVKRRMAQKMQFLSEDVAALREPSQEELQEWYSLNPEKFAEPKRVSFRHVYFSPDRRRGEAAHADAAAALESLAGQPEDSPLASSAGDPFMFQDYYRDRAPDFLAKEFGPKFARAVDGLPAGSWQGPVESGFGWHLVFIDAVIPGRVPDFAEVESDVRTAWLSERKARAWEEAYGKMRVRYTVLLPGPPETAQP